MICPTCKTESGPSLFCYVCDAYLPSASAGAKASIPSRLGAYLLDVLILLALLLAAGAAAAAFGVNVSEYYRAHDLLAFGAVLFGGAFAYLLLCFWLLARGQTPGKWFVSIRAVDKRDGSPPALGSMLIRETLGKWASGLFMGLGWLWAIWDRDAQAWHDKIARTVVLYRRSEANRLLAAGLLGLALILSITLSWHGLTEALDGFRDRSGVAAGPADVTPRAIRNSVLGFRFGESAHDMGKRAGAMGFRLVDCRQRSADAPEYVDCKLVRDSGDALTASLLEGRLQRLDLSFRLENYDQVLQAVERDHGIPRVWQTGPLKGTAEWGSAAEDFNISLGKTADMTAGWLDATDTSSFLAQ